METVNITLDLCDFGLLFWISVILFQAIVLIVCYSFLKPRGCKNIRQQLLLLLPVSLPIMAVFTFLLFQEALFCVNMKENYKDYFEKFISERSLPDVPVTTVNVNLHRAIINFEYLDGQQYAVSYVREDAFTLKTTSDFYKLK